MKRALFHTRKFLKLPPKSNANPILSFIQLASSARPRLGFYSSDSDSSKRAQTQNDNGSRDVEDVSNEELKRRIEKYFEGDEEAIPSIFEAILRRKLSGKHDGSDDELMEEIKQKTLDDVKQDEFDSEEDR